MSEPKHIYPAWILPQDEPSITPLANHRENRIEDLRAALLWIAEHSSRYSGHLQEYALDVLMWDEAHEMNRIHDEHVSFMESGW